MLLHTTASLTFVVIPGIVDSFSSLVAMSWNATVVEILAPKLFGFDAIMHDKLDQSLILTNITKADENNLLRLRRHE